MNAATTAAFTRLGIDVVLTVLQNMDGDKTIKDAIAELETQKTAQQYVDEDAASRGIPPVPILGGTPASENQP